MAPVTATGDRQKSAFPPHLFLPLHGLCLVLLFLSVEGTESKGTGAGAGMVLAAKAASAFKTLPPGPVRRAGPQPIPWLGQQEGSCMFLSEKIVRYF